MQRRRFVAGTCALLAAGLPGLVRAANEPPLSLGIMPFNSPLTLIKTHQPLREHLRASLGREVDLFTSSDYFTFVGDIGEGRFDILIAAPHFAIPAIERGYVPLVRYQADLEFIIIVPTGNHWQAADLRGRRLGVPNRLTIAAIAGVQWMNDQGLKLGIDYSLREYPTHGAVVAALAVGDLDAGVVSRTALRQTPEDVQRRVSVMAQVARVPHLLTLAHRRLGKRLTERLRSALLGFGQTAAGAAFFADTGYQGYVVAGPNDLLHLRPYWETARQLMGWRH